MKGKTNEGVDWQVCHSLVRWVALHRLPRRLTPLYRDAPLPLRDQCWSGFTSRGETCCASGDVRTRACMLSYPEPAPESSAGCGIGGMRRCGVSCAPGKDTSNSAAVCCTVASWGWWALHVFIQNTGRQQKTCPLAPMT